jgi:hypothetical protein
VRAALVALGLLAPAAPQQAVGPELVEVCTQAGLSDRTCVSLEAGSVLLASLCEELGAPPEACAAATDGVAVDEARLVAFEQSWVGRALGLQRQLDEHEPLRNTLWPHTHNSYNSTAYAPTVSGLDPNQRWSILDQLRMGIRAIELDLHPSPDGSGAVVLCHGRQETVGPTTVHLGCSTDRPLSAGLDELRAFLDANPDDVVLLYLENQLEDDPALHDAVAADLERILGPLVLRPPADQPCAEMPLERSRADVVGGGHQVLIVGNCGPGGWGSWVHERGPRWQERSLGDGYAAFPDCIAAERDPLAYDDNWIRVYEDATWLSAMVDGRYNPQTPEDVVNKVRCGVDMVGFDRIDPGDGRLEALIWSWAVDEPVADAAKQCVAWGTDARFRAAACDEERAYACRRADGAWVVPDRRGPASGAEAACATVDAEPATPPTGWENEELRAAAAGKGEQWLSIRNPLAPAPVAAEAPGATPLARTGAPVPLLLAAVLLSLGLAARPRRTPRASAGRPGS